MEDPVVPARARCGAPAAGQAQVTSEVRHILDVGNRVADAAMSGGSVEELADLFARLTGRSVVLLDPALRMRSCAIAPGGAAWIPEHRWTRRLLRALADEQGPMRVPALAGDGPGHGCLAIPIAVGTTALGHLLVLDGPATGASDDVDLLIGSHVATLFALALAHERTSHAVELRHRTMLAEALVHGEFLDPDDAQRKMAVLGFPEPTRFVVGVLRPKREGLGAARLDDTDRLRALLVRAVPGAVTAVRAREMVAIIPWTPARRGMPDPAERIASALAGSHLREGRHPGDPRMTCGLSEVSDEPQEVPRLVRDAEAAVEIGMRIGRVGEVVRYGDLGVYRLLLKVGDLREIWHFASEVLGPLIEHDAAHRLDLVRTLTVFLDKGQSPKRAAQALQVHANTVANRLARIEHLISLDLADSDDLLVAHLAVKILETQGVPNGRAGRLSRIS